jgi:hypothetical protein
MIRVRYALFAALALSALCVPADAAIQWATARNACDVLSDAEAKTLLGAAAHLTRKAQPNPHMSQCQYSSPNGVITVMTGDWRMIHTNNPMDKPVAGLGNEAYQTPGGLVVRKGAVGMTVNVIVQSGEFWGKAADDINAQMAAAERKVATALLPHL